MTLEEAAGAFISPARFKAIQRGLDDKAMHRIHMPGLAGSAPSMLLSRFPGDMPILVIADDPEAAPYFFSDLDALGCNPAFFPSGYKRDIKYGQPDPPARILRTETLERLTSSNPPRFIVTSPEALAEKVADADTLRSNMLRISRGMKLPLSQLIDRLLELGFCKTDYVYEPGQFAVRGSIVDIYSYACEMPFRIDFFDEDVDSLRVFNVETQLSERRVDDIAILPASSGDTSTGVSLLDMMPDDTLIFCRHPENIPERIRQIATQNFSESALIADEGDADSMQKVVNPDSFDKRFSQFRIISYSAAPADSSSIAIESQRNHFALIPFDTAPQTLYHKNFGVISESFSDFISRGFKIFILIDHSSQIRRLRDIFADRGDKIEFTAVQPTIHEGFVDRATKSCFFTDHQIFDRFHNYTLRSDKARGGRVALSLKELNQIEPGDYIVHIDHGIGRFGGLVKTNANGRPQEMIKLFYQNNDLVLVSIHALHKLSKYRGAEAPKISKLGSGAWTRMKERAKSKMKDMARDLIRLYAARRREKGFSFSPDSYLQHELEASFAFEDTPDQIKAIAAVKADMESARPMDRLICGDVGFGKTEIAVRAAFKAAIDGKQTALLVPTTVLAMQHYHTFRDRLADFPVRVEFLSRARRPADVKKILADLKEGKIDILIGTHKIIGNQVHFKDLGLLIIDEEQKFGVAVKEKLKQIRVNVDTLTMSATPIPRTLQFSLMGARDLSSLNTPPANRQPINTAVSILNDDTLREAVNFEISRGGQVFFVTNRIENLAELESRLLRLVPGVRIAIAHGQMPPERVEKAIIDFADQEYDVLLSTTIIENGVDMPNVNTILVNNAHMFGLSELHQLRGRVGRSARKAFCYLFVPSGSPLTPIARRRLQAIESFSDLGSGIHIAMQDLDIRGAGNLLGAEQSGFIADLGYEAYQQILRESVTELKTEEFGDEYTDVTDSTTDDANYFVADVTIESDLELRLPPEYVPSDNERIMLYRSLDAMESEEQVEIFRQQLRDRFGEIPVVSEELIKIVPLRLLAKKFGMERIVLKNNEMRVYFVSAENKAYYQSAAFGKVLTYMANNPLGCKIHQAGERRMAIFSPVADVSTALSLLSSIAAGV